MSVLVYSTGGKFEVLPASAQAILGEYAEDGENHGRKVYRRASAPGQATVLLYYYDARDGKDLCGWWFGDQIGGGQVWGRAAESTTLMPPMKGWKCPVDGPVSKHVVCVPKMRAQDAAAREPDVSSRNENKRPVDERGLAAPPAKRCSQSEVFVLASSLGEKATKVVHKLVGEYAESGENHGRKVYEKKTDGSGDHAVWLYFWDQRDGYDCSGWWLGASVGGAQVFARSTHQGSTPSLKGWKIPYDGAVKSDVTLTVKGSAEDREMLAAERLENVKKMVAELKARSEKVLETARPVLHPSGDIMEEGMAAVYEILRGLSESLIDAKASVERHCKAAAKQGASEELEAQLTLEEESLDSFSALVESELSKARAGLKVAQLGNAEQKDSKTLEKALQAVLESVSQAEVAAESAGTINEVGEAQRSASEALHVVSKTMNASLRYAPEAWKSVETDFISLRDRCTSVAKQMASLEKSLAIGAAGASMATHDAEAGAASLSTVQLAVEQAEESVVAAVDIASEHRSQLKCGLDELGRGSRQVAEEIQAAADAAQESISIARGRTDGLARASKQLPAAEQSVLLEDIAELRKRTAEAQKKLSPHKKARYEYDQKLKAKQDSDAFGVQMSSLEADVDAVAAVFSSLPSEEEVQRAEGSLPSLLSTLSSKMQEVGEKSMNRTGSNASLFVAILDRAKVAKEKIEDLKISSKECRKRLKAQAILDEAEALVQNAEEWQDRMSQAEEPWVGNVELVPEIVAKPALEACARVAEKAEPAVKALKVKVMEKLVDVRQVPEGPLRFETAEVLNQLQARVDKIALNVTQLKIDTYARKTKLLMPEVIVAVSLAEDKVQKVTEAAGPLEADNLENAANAADVKASCKNTLEVEKAAAKECIAARAAIESKKDDPRFAVSPSFRTQLLKLESRLDIAQKQSATLREAADHAERSKAFFEVQKKELQVLTAHVEEIELAALPLGDELPSADADERTAELIESTRMKLAEWQSAAELVASSHAHGSLRHAMKRLVAQGDKLRVSLTDSRKSAGSRLNGACLKIFLREGTAQVQKAEQTMIRTDQAEGPFLRGVEDLSSEQAEKAVAQCSIAAASAQKVIDHVCTFFRTRAKDVSGYKEEACKDDVVSFIELSKQASNMKTKLTQFLKSTELRKSQCMNA